MDNQYLTLFSWLHIQVEELERKLKEQEQSSEYLLHQKVLNYFSYIVPSFGTCYILHTKCCLISVKLS